MSATFITGLCKDISIYIFECLHMRGTPTMLCKNNQQEVSVCHSVWHLSITFHLLNKTQPFMQPYI